MTRIVPDPERFFDGGSLDGTQPPSDQPPTILLLRVMVTKGNAAKARRKETFELQRRIGYRARWDNEKDLRVLVPAVEPSTGPGPRFRTDLTSVPNLFTWLVPRTGSHLPAALVHDGLIYDKDEPASYDADMAVSRIRADHIFRDAMADLGTGIVRRWLMWSAVSLATVWAGISSVSPPRQTSAAAAVASSSEFKRRADSYYRIVVVLTLAIIFVLGTVATLDLFDVVDWLPWMGNRWWLTELVFGLGVAVLIPLALSLFWGRLRRAGVIVGVAFAVLFHVSVALLLLTGMFQGAEWISRRLRGADEPH